MTTEILILLLAFQAKHLIADYYLQFPYMYENKGKEKGWLGPLFDHAGIHAAFTFWIVLFLTTTSLWIAFSVFIFDFTTHFITDRWKATRKTDPSQSWFWQSLGIDQMIHHTVGILIIWWITC